MTDNEIIKALESIINRKPTFLNPAPITGLVTPNGNCVPLQDILDLINRQKAEIEMLRKKLSLADDCLDKISDASESIYSNEYTMTFIEEYYDHLTELTEKEGE